MEWTFFLYTLVVQVGSGTTDLAYFHLDTQVFFREFCGLYDGEVRVPFATARATVFAYGFQGFSCHLIGKAPCRSG
jgi:hypothetical protein